MAAAATSSTSNSILAWSQITARLLSPERLLVAVCYTPAHLGQIVKTMAKQYSQAIGPWRELLPIIDSA